MGVGYNFICRDCKKYYRLGYGSYRTWILAWTLKEFDENAVAKSESLGLQKNKNMRHCLQLHAGHKAQPLNTDYSVERDGKLYEENASPYSTEPDRLIDDLGGYERLDLEENPPVDPLRDAGEGK